MVYLFIYTFESEEGKESQGNSVIHSFNHSRHNNNNNMGSNTDSNSQDEMSASDVRQQLEAMNIPDGMYGTDWTISCLIPHAEGWRSHSKCQHVKRRLVVYGDLIYYVCVVDVLQSALVEAMRTGLDKLVGTSSGYLESLPASVRSRIDYLESIQADYDAVEDEIKALEEKYKPMFDKLLLLRKSVVSGEEPVPEEFVIVEDAEDAEEEEEEEVAGIPDFWLVALCNHPMFDEMVGFLLFLLSSMLVCV